jgi:hypothetical protein
MQVLSKEKCNDPEMRAWEWVLELGGLRSTYFPRWEADGAKR